MIDFTAAKGFKAMLEDFSSRKQQVFWVSCKTSVADSLKSVAGSLFVQINNPEEIFEHQKEEEETKVLLEEA